MNAWQALGLMPVWHCLYSTLPFGPSQEKLAVDLAMVLD